MSQSQQGFFCFFSGIVHRFLLDFNSLIIYLILSVQKISCVLLDLKARCPNSSRMPRIWTGAHFVYKLQ